MNKKVAVGVAGGVVVVAAVLAALGFQGRALVVGMDLGTTYSTAAYRRGHEGVRVVVNGGVDGRATASVIALAPATGEFVVGRAAAAVAARHPWAAVFDAKRVLGRRSDGAGAGGGAGRQGGRLVRHRVGMRNAFGKVVSGAAALARCHACEPEVAFLVAAPAGGARGRLASRCLDAGSLVPAAELGAVSPAAAAAVAAGGAAAVAPAYLFVTPTAAGCMVVETLMAALAAEVGHRQFSSAVVTIPADFSAASRQCTVDAYARAGITARRVLHEPAAAAMAYGLHVRPAVKHVLVFDMGGGTLDVSVLFMQPAAITVIGAAGDGHLGGQDVDDCLADVLAGQAAAAGVAPAACGDPDADADATGSAPPAGGAAQNAGAASAGGGLRGVAERVKIAFGNASVSEVTWHCNTDSGTTFSSVVTRQQFYAGCDALFTRVMAPVTEALDAANVAASEVDEIVLIGGSSRLTRVQELLAAHFARRLHWTIDPDLAVAYGAASVID